MSKETKDSLHYQSLTVHFHPRLSSKATLPVPLACIKSLRGLHTLVCFCSGTIFERLFNIYHYANNASSRRCEYREIYASIAKGR